MSQATPARWLRLLAAPLASLLLCVPCAGLAAEVMSFGFILSPQSQLERGAAAFAAHVGKATGGRYAIELFPDAMPGGEVEMLKAIQLATIDLAVITGAPLPTVVPEAGVCNIPFLFHDIADARAPLDGPLGDECRRKFDRVGIAARARGENGMRELTTSRRPVRTPADLVGLRRRLPQSEVMTAGFEALGAEVRQIAFSEVSAALQSGRVDAEENPVATILSAPFGRVQTTLTDHVYDPAVVLISKERFDELPSGDRAALRQAAIEAIEAIAAAGASRRAASEAAPIGIAASRAAGMTVIADVDRAALAEKSALAAPEFERRFGRDVIDGIRAFRAAPLPREGASGAAPRP